MLKREILLTGCAIVLALSAQEAKAAEACTATPTCAELGYTQTNCRGLSNLKCPFDSTKLFCGANRQVIYSGSTAIGVAISSNLAVAMTDEGIMIWYDAVARCKAKTTGGKSWRLPTKDELVAIRNIRAATDVTLQLNGGSETSSGYWSSTEYSSTHALGVALNSSYIGSNDKANNDRVRCVFDF